MTLKALTLDVGHTLLFPDPSFGDVCAAVGRRHDLEIEPESIEAMFTREWLRGRENSEGLVYGTTHQEALQFWYRVNRAMFSPETLSDSALDAYVHDLYQVFGSAASWRVNEGLQAIIDAASRAGIRIGLISNWDLRLRPLLEELSFTTWADPIVISAEAGLEKPDPRLFESALSTLDTAAETVLHVGDSWEDDVMAARGCGMRAAWFNPAGKALPDASDPILDLRRLDDLSTWLTPS